MQHRPGSRCVGSVPAAWTLVCGLVLLAGCASKPCHERGWVGGTTEPARCADGFLATAPSDRGADVVGVPPGLTRGGLVVTRVPGSSPAATAGLRESDLILAVDGTAVTDPEALREDIEARTPGTTVNLDVWRCGARHCIPVVVGRETYRRSFTVALWLPLKPVAQLDLWPFDDGVDVLGVVRAKCDSRRYDLDTPERRYLACAHPGACLPAPRQEMVEVGVLPLFLGRHVEVLRQEAAPAGR